MILYWWPVSHIYMQLVGRLYSNFYVCNIFSKSPQSKLAMVLILIFYLYLNINKCYDQWTYIYFYILHFHHLKTIFLILVYLFFLYVNHLIITDTSTKTLKDAHYCHKVTSYLPTCEFNTMRPFKKNKWHWLFKIRRHVHHYHLTIFLFCILYINSSSCHTWILF